jgi:hypothetical protein
MHKHSYAQFLQNVFLLFIVEKIVSTVRLQNAVSKERSLELPPCDNRPT